LDYIFTLFLFKVSGADLVLLNTLVDPSSLWTFHRSIVCGLAADCLVV